MKTKKHPKETTNKMAVMPVPKLMLSMGIPMVLSMMLQAAYNIVDSAFVGGMKENGEIALNALTLAFPVQMLMVAVAIGTGVGMGAMLSMRLGQGEREKVAQAAGNGIFLGMVIYVVFLLFGLFGAKAYIASQTQNGLAASMAVTYLRICCVMSMGIVFFSIYEKLLQATGNSLYSTIAQIAGAITNIVLDPIMTYGLNLILGTISESAVTAYDLYYKVQQFILFAAFGLRDAITPIVSFNYGKRDKKRVQGGIRCGLLYTLVIMLFGTLLLETGASAFATLFGLSGETREMCISAMRVISLSFLFAGANVAFQGIFQALESGLESLVISVCRQMLFVLPVAYGFSLIARVEKDRIWLVWLTFLLAEALSCAIACGFMARLWKRKIKEA